MNSAPEMSWWVWCLLFAAGASALAALSVAAAQVLSPRIAWAISAMRQSKIKALFLLVFLVGMIQYGATKGTNGNSPSACASSRSVQDSTLLISPVACDSDSLYAGGSPVTNFMFCGIERYPESVLLALAWPDSFSFINNRIDLYCHWCLATNNWHRIAQVDLSNSSSNAVIELPNSILPTNALCKAAFFIAADQSDSDGDGLSDTFEKIVSGSGSAAPDTDGDGVFDGEEIRLGTECTAADSDKDGLSDAEELGTVTVLPPTETWWRYFGEESEVWSSSYYGSSGSFVFNLPSPYTVNGVVYTQIRVCVDGLIYLLSPENPQWGFIEQISIPPQLSATLLSSKHIAIAGFCADLYVRAKMWGSKVCYGSTDISSGRASVIEFCDFGFASDVISGAMNLFTFQLILPSDEPNVFYLTYRPIPSSYYASNNPTIGVQCPMLNPRTQNEAYYNLTLSPSDSFFSSMRTVRFFIGCGTDPKKADTDGDGFSDGEEVAVLKTDPNVSDEDSDNDGLPDAVEILMGSNAERSDTDYDGLSDLEEFSLGLNILQPDTDGDGMNDGWENRYADIGFDPALDNSADVNLNNDPYADMDSDGLPNSEECGEVPHQFWFWDESTGSPIWTKKEKGDVSW